MCSFLSHPSDYTGLETSSWVYEKGNFYPLGIYEFISTEFANADVGFDFLLIQTAYLEFFIEVDIKNLSLGFLISSGFNYDSHFKSSTFSTVHRW